MKNSPVHRQRTVDTQTKAKPLLYVTSNYSIADSFANEQINFAEVLNGRKYTIENDSIV